MVQAYLTSVKPEYFIIALTTMRAWSCISTSKVATKVKEKNNYVVVEVVVVDVVAVVVVDVDVDVVVVVAAPNVTKTTEVVDRSGIAFFSVACRNKTHFRFVQNPKL